MSEVVTQIGPYRGTPVAGGGFATVYRVEGVDGRPAALKWVDPGAERVVADALYHECNVLLQLVHPQLPQLLDFGRHDDRPFMVTEWIGGSTLWEGPRAPAESDFTGALRQLARALLFLHHRGWVHGDLKPDNLRWRSGSGSHDPCGCASGEQVLCLLDLGLARPVGDAGRPRGAGTVGYCAPEFLRNEPADGRADWYAVGAILYEWIFGRRPFASADTAAEIAGHLESSPDFDGSPVRPAPSWAVAVIRRLLSKNPAARGDSVVSLLEWMARFDPACDPCAILNSDLDWHRQSQDRSHDERTCLLVETLKSDLSAHTHVHWQLVGNAPGADHLPAQLSLALMQRRFDVEVRHNDREGAPASRLHGAGTGDGTTVEVTAEWYTMPEYERRRSEAAFAPCRVVTLLPYDVLAVRQYLQGLTGDEEFSKEWADLVHRHTGGLPQVISSVLRHLIGRRQLQLGAEGWTIGESALREWLAQPEAQSMLAAVVGPLTDGEKALCDLLAVGRSQGCRRILEEMGDEGQGQFAEHFDHLIARGIIVFGPAADNSMAFDTRLRLAALADVWLAGMLQSKRCALAAALAERIEQGMVTPELTRVAVLADCFADAGRWENSAEQSLQGASLDIAADRPEPARRHVEAALAAAASITDATSRAQWLGRVQLVRGQYEKAIGRIDTARRTYRELLALGRRMQAPRLLAETLRELGDLYRITRRFDKGVCALQIARRIWGELGDQRELSRVLTNLGNLYWVASDRDRAQSYYEEALTMQRALGLDRRSATTMSNLGAIHLGKCEFARADSYLHEALAIQRRLRDSVGMAGSLNNIGAIQFMQGQLEESAGAFTEAALLNAQAGARSEEIYNRRNLVEVMLERGNLRDAVQTGNAVLRVAEELGDVATGTELLALLAEAYLRAGDFRTAQRHLDRASKASMLVKNDELRIQLALVTASRKIRLGQLDHARELLDAAAPAGLSTASRYLHLDLMILRLRLAVEGGDHETAQTLWHEGRDEAEAIGAVHKAAQFSFALLPEDPSSGECEIARRQVEEFLDGSPDWHWTGAFRMWTARRLLALGEWEPALRAGEQAVARLRREGNWEALWRALAVLGQVHYRQVDYEPAMRLFNEALRILDTIIRTIADDDDRTRYESQRPALLLVDSRKRITQLVS